MPVVTPIPTTTHKGLIAFTLGLVICLLIGGLLMPHSFFMSFASTDPTQLWIRAVVASLLTLLLLSTPPRAMVLRVILAFWSVTLCYLALRGSLAYQLAPLDAVMFIELAIIFALEALEARRPAQLPPVPQTRTARRRKITVVSV